MVQLTSLFTSQMELNSKERKRSPRRNDCVTSGDACERQFTQPGIHETDVSILPDTCGGRPKKLRVRAPARQYRNVPTYPVSPQDTLRFAADSFLAWLTDRCKAGLTSASNLRQKKYGLRALEILGLADVCLRDLKRSHVIGWVEALAMTPDADGSIPRSREYVSLRCLQALIRWAADRDAVSLDVVARVRHTYRSAPGRALTWEQLETLRAALRERDVAGAARDAVRYLRIVADNGPRAYEIREATAAQVDFVAGCIRWTRGKNGKPRVIVLSEVSLLLCQLQIQEHGAGHLFPSPLKPGQPWSHQAMNRHLANICRDVGLPHSSLKDLRTTFATVAYQRGCTLEDIAEGMSHSSTETTKRFYIDALVRPGARRANAALNPGGAKC